MNTQPNAVPESPGDSQGVATSAMSETRPMYWSVRRELWEIRSIYIVPLIAAGVYLLGFLISLFWLPHSVRALSALDPAQQRIQLAMPYAHAGMLIMAVAFIVGIFYSIEALHGERRDRSILFWKSLPVSDRTTVLSKASIPLVVLPLLVFAITVVLQIIMVLLSIAVLLMSGASTATPWAPPLFEMQFVLLYGAIVIVLWHAPIYCWFLLVSGWARRAAFYGPCCRWSRLASSSTSRSTHRTSAPRCTTGCLDLPRPLSTSKTRMASRSMGILFRSRNLLREGF